MIEVYVGFAGLTKEKCILPPGRGGERVAWGSEVTVSWTLRYGVEGGGGGVYGTWKEAWNTTEGDRVSLRSIRTPLMFLIKATPGSYLCAGPISLESHLGGRKATCEALTSLKTRESRGLRWGEGAANMQNGRETVADTDQRRGGASVALT